METECRTHPTPHRGLCWGFSLLFAHSCLGLTSVPATCERGRWERSMNRKPCGKEPVQSNERNPQSLLKKQKGNAGTCTAPYCFSLGTFHLLPACQSSSVWQEGHQRRAYPCEAHFISLCMGNRPNSWVTFSPFSRARPAAGPSDICVLQARGGSVTHEGHVPGQAPAARARPAPLSTGSCVERQPPAEVLAEDPRAHRSWRAGAVSRVT